jgi:hypothetical protein
MNRALSLAPRLHLVIFSNLKNTPFSLYYFVKRNGKMPTIALRSPSSGSVLQRGEGIADLGSGRSEDGQ